MEYVTYSKLCKLYMYYHLQIVDAKKKKRFVP